MRERRRDRPLEVALSAVLLSGAGADETRKWAEMYAKEREHRFPVPPTADDVLESNLWGDADAMVERLARWVEAGADHVVIQPMPPVDGMRFFGENVLPRLA
jgi:FMNH2-dependent dimethyl sulfone monooxygenase